uniref:BTB domain-containing protein n=1 Tax=Parastrongyloides trichosuri TaxID=131310 RepID=A0A0N5A4P4_PARTI
MKFNQDVNEWLKTYRENIEMKQSKQGVLKLHINTEGRFFDTIIVELNPKIANLPWTLSTNCEYELVSYSSKRKLLVNLKCNPNSESCFWRCWADIEIRVKHISGDNDKDIVKNGAHKFDYTSNSFECDVGYEDTICGTYNGYLIDGHITIEVLVKVIEVSGVMQEMVIDFTNPTKSENCDLLQSDVALNINGIKIFVNKKYLSTYSNVFKKMFWSPFAESKMDEICLKDVNVAGFVQLLEIIYPMHKNVTDENVEILLELSERFEILYVMDQCEKFLIQNNKINHERKLYLSDRYRLTELQDVCISRIDRVNLITHFKEHETYKDLSLATKVVVFEKFAELMKKNHF